MTRLGKSALIFVTIGIALYAGVYCAAEQLLYRTGKTNPFYKIATSERVEFDWVILGASHAMPLDFADFNGFMERETGLRIINLAAPGTGPLYNRFVLEQFLAKHRVRNMLYVVDSFAFYSALWNEDRFADAKLLRRTPASLAVARRLIDHSRRDGIDPRAVLDYVSGFSKINNRERFEPDIWEGEKQFDRVYRTSTAAVRSRIDYLYPKPPTAAALSRYLAEFEKIVTLARERGINVVAIKMPVPAQYRGRIPNEAAFDDAMTRLAAAQRFSFHDLSKALDEPRYYFDTDHLNRAGLTLFFHQELKKILTGIP